MISMGQTWNGSPDVQFIGLLSKQAALYLFSTDNMKLYSVGHAESIRLLASYGARLDVVTDDGWTATHFACEQGKILALRALYKSGASIDMEDGFGDTPQRVAEIYGHHDCVEFVNEARIEIEEKKRQAEIEAKIEAEKKRIEEEKAKQIKFLKNLTEKKEKKSLTSRWKKGKK